MPLNRQAKYLFPQIRIRFHADSTAVPSLFLICRNTFYANDFLEHLHRIVAPGFGFQSDNTGGPDSANQIFWRIGSFAFAPVDNDHARASDFDLRQDMSREQ